MPPKKKAKADMPENTQHAKLGIGVDFNVPATIQQSPRHQETLNQVLGVFTTPPANGNVATLQHATPDHDPAINASTHVYCCCRGYSNEQRCNSAAGGGTPMEVAARTSGAYHKCSKTGNLVWNGFCLHGSDSLDNLNDIDTLMCKGCHDITLLHDNDEIEFGDAHIPYV